MCGDNLVLSLKAARTTTLAKKLLNLVNNEGVKPFKAVGTGKDGLGVMPVVGEPVGDPAVYGPDRVFLYLWLDGDDSQDTAVSTLKAAGFPVITARWHDLSDLGGQFFLWQMATAVAAHHLNISPFSQSQADALKAQIRELVARIQVEGESALPKAPCCP